MSEFLIELSALDDPAEAGAKAANLARLAGAGLPIPAAVVLSTGAHAEWLRAGKGAVSDQLREQLAPVFERLGPAMIARSSAAIEDRLGHSAAGVFASRQANDLEGLVQAVRSVWESAQSPTAHAYTRARGIDPDVAMCVILQRRVRGKRGVAYTRPPGRPDRDRVLLEIGERAATCNRQGALIEIDPKLDIDAAQITAICRAAIAAESAIDATSGADVEWVIDDELWLVQARPIVHPKPTDFSAAREVIAATADSPEVVWRWDATHNPDPLSPAQIGLVNRVMDSGAAVVPMRVLGGYLYVAELAAPPVAPITEAELTSLFDSEVSAPIERILQSVEDPAPPSLPAALRAYDDVYRIYGQVATPALSNARRYVRDLVDDPVVAAQILGAGNSTLDAALDAVSGSRMTLAELEVMCAPLSPAWDVAAPTYGDRPWLLHAAAKRYRQRPALERPAVAEPIQALAEAVRRLGAADDLLFARAQAAVRAALLQRASSWGLESSERIFFAPLEQVVGATSGEWIGPVARQGRQAWHAQAQIAMPLAVCNGSPQDVSLPSEPGILRGAGAGGRAQGPIVRIQSWGPAQAIAPGSIVLAQTLTPAAVFVIQGAAGIVCEHGGLLDHGAAMARELGLPCVVGCTGAWRALADQDVVLVDGEAGLVLRVD